MFRLSHSLNRQRCLKNAKWIGDTLYCSKCKEPIAIRYIFDDELRVFVFLRYKKYKQEILELQSTQDFCDDINGVSFVEMDEVIATIKDSISDMDIFTAYEEIDEDGEESTEYSENGGCLGNREDIDDDLCSYIE